MIVSMGPVAGSGGYWIATPGRHIMAQATTITGSIGVYIGKIVMHDFWKSLLVNRELIERGEHTSIYSDEAAFDKSERKIIWGQIQRIYDLFLDRVSESRSIGREQVDEIGGGRVWTGRQAVENGLVDEIGGLEKAILKAKEMAGLDARAPVRMIFPGKQPLVPIGETAAMVEYLVQGAGLFNGARPLCFTPWDFGNI